jgi:hypothetical protein
MSVESSTLVDHAALRAAQLEAARTTRNDPERARSYGSGDQRSADESVEFVPARGRSAVHKEQQP